MGCTANSSLQSVFVINTHLFAAILPFLGLPSEMVFLADLGLRLHGSLCGCRSPPRKRWISPMLTKPGTRPAGMGLSTRSVGGTRIRREGMGLSSRRRWASGFRPRGTRLTTRRLEGKILISGLESGLHWKTISAWTLIRFGSPLWPAVPKTDWSLAQSVRILPWSNY